MKRIMGLFLAFIMVITVLPINAFAVGESSNSQGITNKVETRTVLAPETSPEPTVEPTPEPSGDSTPEVTRVQWIQAIVETFSMYVEEDNYPDNYYNDIFAEDEFYKDIMIAVEFGIINLEAGKAFQPHSAATREFAAQTLNFALGFQLDENVEYTFSEYDSVAFPKDIQVAINRGWLELNNGAFLPEKNITAAEKDFMLKDAEEVISKVWMEDDHTNSIVLQDYVVRIPEGTTVNYLEQYVIELVDCDKELKVNDVFFFDDQGFPLVGKVVDILKEENSCTVFYTTEGVRNAIISIDYQSSAKAELENFKPAEATTYLVGDTVIKAHEATYSLKNELEETSIVINRELEIEGISVNFSCEVSDINFDCKLGSEKEETYLKVTSNVVFSEKASFDYIGMLGEDTEIELGVFPMPGGANVKVVLVISITGEISVSLEGVYTSQVSYNERDGLRISCDFQKSNFSIEAEITGKLGIGLHAGIDWVIASIDIFAEIGAKSSLKATQRTDGPPYECKSIFVCMYMDIGASAEIFHYENEKWGIEFGFKGGLENSIFDENNSPVKIHNHYEDGFLTPCCNYGSDATLSDYYTSADSKYFDPSLKDAHSTYIDAEGNMTEWIRYTVNDNGEATITGMIFTPSVLVIPETIDGYTVTAIANSAFGGNLTINALILPDTVKTIGQFAFEGCMNLSVLALSDNLEKIGYRAFKDCISLTRVTIPETITAGDSVFVGCYNLKTVVLKDGLKAVPNSFFSACTGLKNIFIPESVTKINSSAFAGCINLETVTLPSTLESIGSYAFSGSGLKTITIPKSVTAGGLEAFANCPNLKTVILENGITTVPNYLLSGCTSIESIVIPDTVTAIKTSAFDGATSLKSVTLSNNLTKIDSQAFENCTSLETITLPGALESIGSYAFSGSGLKTITIPKSVTAGGLEAFANCPNLKTVILENGITTVPNYLLSGCTSIESIVTPDTVTAIKTSAFDGATSLKSVTLSNNLTKIDSQAFENCTSLETITLPGALESISSYAFSGSGLKSITIPENVKECGLQAFANCPNLKTVTLEDGITAVPNYLLSGCTSVESIVIPDTVTAIKTSAFEGATSLKSVTIPENISKIYPRAFENCTNLSDVYYGGSISAWNKVTVSSNNEYLTNATMHYEKVDTYTITVEEAENGTIAIEKSTVPAGETVTVVAIPAENYKLKAIYVDGEPIEGTTFTVTGNHTVTVEFIIDEATVEPTATPTVEPTVTPTVEPTATPTVEPTATPTVEPTATPTVEPTVTPTVEPTATPTVEPTATPTVEPTATPTVEPTAIPTAEPTATPTVEPTATPTAEPTATSTVEPTATPTVKPTATPVPVNKVKITKQPASVTVASGQTAKVSFTATGDGLTYTWYYKNPGSSSFTKTTTFKGNSYEVQMSKNRNGRQVYCVVKDKYGNSVTTNTVTLSMKAEAVKITVQPQNVSVKSGQTAKVSFTATGDGLTYTWYYKNPGSSKFTKTTSFKANSYEVQMSKDRNGRQIYCVVKDKYGNKVQTNTVTLSMKADPVKITTQPISVSVSSGKTAKVTVKATGDGLKYAWYYKDAGSSSFKKTDSFKGASYSVSMNKSRNGRQVYCVVTDKYGNTAKSDVVTLSMKVELKITTQPTSVTVANGKTAKVTVKASGEGLTYTWYYKDAASSLFKKTDSFKGASYSVSMTKARSGRQVYCVITDKYSNKVQTNTVTLKMK